MTRKNCSILFMILLLGLGALGVPHSMALAQPLTAADRSLVIHRAYLPLVRVIYPPLPEKSILKAIDNSDRDDEYYVEWWPTAKATSYVLQEDNNPQFSTPRIVYEGTATTRLEPGLSPGTRFYRVQGVNSYGAGPWSAPEGAVVPPPWGIWVIQNDTGGNLTLEVFGYHTASYPAGRHEWELPSGTYTYKASASCGSLQDTIDIPRYGRTVAVRFWCRSWANQPVLSQ